MDNAAMDVQIAIALIKLFDHLRGKLITINTYGPHGRTKAAVYPQAMAEIAPLSEWTFTKVAPTYPDGTPRHYQYEAFVEVEGVLFTSLPCEDDLPDELKPVPVGLSVAAMAEAVPA